MKTLTSLLATTFVSLAFAATSALAAPTTECANLNPTIVFVGSDTVGGPSYIWAAFDNGAASVIPDSAPIYKSVLAVLLTAKSQQRPLTVRYSGASVSCTAQNPAPVLGVWLY